MSTTETGDSLLTARDVAERLKVHPQTVYRAVRAHKFPQPLRVLGHSLRWKRSDIEAIPRQRRTG